MDQKISYWRGGLVGKEGVFAVSVVVGFDVGEEFGINDSQGYHLKISLLREECDKNLDSFGGSYQVISVTQVSSFLVGPRGLCLSESGRQFFGRGDTRLPRALSSGEIG